MKKTILSIATIILCFTSQGQSIRNTIGTGGEFEVRNSDLSNFTKLKILSTGEVRMFLDGADMYIRESNFEYEPTKFGTYDFLKVDGTNGRIGFNVLSNTAGGVDDDFMTSSVNLFGSIATRVRLLDGTNNYTVKQDDHTLIIDNSNGNAQTDLILPLVANSKGRQIRLKRNSDGTDKIYVKPTSGDQLNGEIDEVVDMNNENSSLEVVCDGVSWWVLTELSPNLLAVSTTTNYVVELKDDLVLADASSGALFVDLPSAATVSEGNVVTLKRTNTGANYVTVRTDGTETIDGLAELRLNQVYDYLTLVSDGTNWLIKSERISSTFVVNPVSPYDVSPYDETISGNAASTYNLPSVNEVLIGKKITIKNTATAGNPNITVDPDGTETIEGGAAGASISLAKGDAVTLQSDGTGWFIISFFSLP